MQDDDDRHRLTWPKVVDKQRASRGPVDDYLDIPRVLGSGGRAQQYERQQQQQSASEKHVRFLAGQGLRD
jgi:hypothetical protein